MKSENLTKELTLILEDFDQNRGADMSIFINRINLLFETHYTETLNDRKKEVIEFVKNLKT